MENEMSTMQYLLAAIRAQNVPVIIDLITKYPALINAHDATEAPSLGSYGQTPLIAAAIAGYVDIVRSLLEHGADVNHTTFGCCNTDALYGAISDGTKNIEVIRLLLNAGANPNSFNDCLHTSALSEAAHHAEHSIIELLLAHGASINYQGPAEEGVTPLMAAAIAGNKATCELLLKHHADPTCIDLNEETATMKAQKNGYAEIVHLLEQHSKL